MIAAILLFVWLTGFMDKKYLVFAIAFGIIFLLNNLSADLGNRWVYPFQNVLGRRLLPNPKAVEFFANCGMPVSPALMRMGGEFANGQERAFYIEPELEDYRSWLYLHGKPCYSRWLLSNPLQSIKQPIDEFDGLAGMQKIPPFLFSKTFSPILPARLEAIFTLRQHFLFVFILISSIAVIAIFNRSWRWNKAWSVCILLIVLLFPNYFIVWHGDTQGIERHMVSVGIQLYLGMWVTALLVLDDVVMFISNRRTIKDQIQRSQIQ
jgi:hypothetical protein